MMSAVSFSSIPACAFSQKNTVFSVCSAHNPTAVIRVLLMLWSWGDGGNRVFCHLAMPCNSAF
eukprot:1382089-Rhodomonas_salina.1